MRVGLLIACSLAVAATAVAIEPGDVRMMTPRPVSPQNQDDLDHLITAQIRAQVAGDPSLSSNAHNVEINTEGGIVVLKGPVDSTEEKAAIEAKARSVGGVKEVTSQLEVVSR